MSRTTSIAGVRPLGWLARVRAQRSCLADGSRALRGCGALLGPIMALGRERAMSMRVSSGARPSCYGYLFTPEFANGGRPRAVRAGKSKGTTQCGKLVAR